MTPHDVRETRACRAALTAVTLAAIVFLAATVLLPLGAHAGIVGSEIGRLLYAPLCHQDESRSLHVAGVVQAVCARCCGLYLGGVAGLAAARLRRGSGMRLRPGWLAVAAIPTLVDVALAWVGLPGAPNLPRLLLAAPLGAIAAAFLAEAIEDGARSGFLPAIGGGGKG
jgi:uncharacterized membrane protein